jgi:site-specific DNA-methyltransferase (adenine-specific)
VRVLGEQSGDLSSGARVVGQPRNGITAHLSGLSQSPSTNAFSQSTGTAARFFPQFWPDGDDAPFHYQAKASRSEREAGCEGMEERGKPIHIQQSEGRQLAGQNVSFPVANHHPTVKAIGLMRWLARIVTPPGGVVLDPFMGSGSTGVACAREGFGFIGIEQSPDYYAIAEARIMLAEAQQRMAI